ncbi:MAG TPA: MFS transporter [Candidatus Limnocylindrales bacterium]|nr:MFS transporter [Candidatus Limnocylindrales bacterium]
MGEEAAAEPLPAGVRAPRSVPPGTSAEPDVDPPVAQDRPRALVAIFTFSFALGIGGLALPLVALAAGYDAVVVGLLTATSAISQFLFRLGLPQLLGKVPDRVLITLSCITIAASYGILMISTLLPVFVVAQLMQGAARALFWTASQTHAARSGGRTVRLLAEVGLVGGIGQLCGPLVTGFIAAISLQLALGTGVAVGVIGALFAATLSRLEPYARGRHAGDRRRLWLSPGIDAACWSAFVGGGWRALMSSYVPVTLTAAGLAPGLIGTLMACGELSSTFAIALLVRLPSRRALASLDAAVLAACVGLAIVPLVASQPILVALALAASGAGAGPITALSAAVARQFVQPEHEGDAIALVGTFRAGALLVAPAAVAVVLGSVAVGPALAGAGLLMGVPSLVSRAARRA